MKDSTPKTRQQMQDEASTIESLLKAAMALTATGSEQDAFNLVAMAHGRTRKLNLALDAVNEPAKIGAAS